MGHGSNQAAIIEISVTCETDEGMIAIYGCSLAAKPSSKAYINAAIYKPFSKQDYCRQQYMTTPCYFRRE